MNNAKNEKTMQFQIPKEHDKEMREALQNVYNSLKEKGYNPVNQIVGYILSEDPTYITNHNNARAIITKIDKYELMRALVQNFIQM